VGTVFTCTGALRGRHVSVERHTTETVFIYMIGVQNGKQTDPMPQNITTAVIIDDLYRGHKPRDIDLYNGHYKYFRES